MSRGPCTFRQSDVAKALKAARAAGQPVSRFEITRDGRIIVILGTGGDTELSPAPAAVNPWDEVIVNGKTAL